MNRILLCGILAAGCCLSSGAQSKINNAGLLRINQFNQLKAELAEKAPARAAAFNNQTVSLFVTLNEGATSSDLEEWGAQVIDVAGDIAIATLPMERVEELAAQEFVKLVDFGYQATSMMDQARRLSFVEDVHSGTAQDLPQAYKGKNVYVGLYDTGLDPNHVNFTDPNGVSRVKAVYLSRGGSVSSYETPADVSRFDTDDRTESHGTHVLGTIAGRSDISGTYARAENTSAKIETGMIPYYGVAPEADIIIGCGSFDNASINAGIGAVIARAKKDNKPVIVNLSLGHNRGSHDPRETVNQYLDRQANDAIIVVAAGNEGGSQMSIERNFRTGGDIMQTTIIPVSSDPNRPSANATDPTIYSAEFWADSNIPFYGELFLYDKVKQEKIATKTFSGKSGSFSWSTSNDQVFGQYFKNSSVSAVWGTDASTGRFNLSLDNTMQAVGADVIFGVYIESDDAMRINAYCDAYGDREVRFANATGLIPSITGNDNGSINGMACGYNTISVGAWVSRTMVPMLGGRMYSNNAGAGVGSIAGFSSHGRSGDGRMLPIVCAPGAQIISSVSSYWTEYNQKDLSQTVWSAKADFNGKTYPWYYMQGTSMATPFVTGAIALWLEAFPAMRHAEVKQIIEKTSTKDAYTATAGEADKWGAGKINVLEGLKEAIRMNASVESTLVDAADQNLMVIDNGGKQFEVSCAGVNNLSCKLFNLQGMEVASAATADDTINLDASALQDGIYVLSVDAAGQKLSRKLVIR